MGSHHTPNTWEDGGREQTLVWRKFCPAFGGNAELFWCGATMATISQKRTAAKGKIVAQRGSYAAGISVLDS